MSIYKIKIKATTPGQPAVFEPKVLTAYVNDSVFWSNDDKSNAHWPAPSAATPNAWLDFQIAPAGESSSIALNPTAPYTLNYVCALHPTEKGQIKVVVGKKKAYGHKTKKGAYGHKTKKGAYGRKTKKGAFGKKTKLGKSK